MDETRDKMIEAMAHRLWHWEERHTRGSLSCLWECPWVDDRLLDAVMKQMREAVGPLLDAALAVAPRMRHTGGAFGGTVTLRGETYTTADYDALLDMPYGMVAVIPIGDTDE